jgi:hypothetical protein
MKLQPSTRVRQTVGGCASSGSRAALGGISVSRTIVNAETRKVAALTNSARSTSLTGTQVSMMPESSARPEKTAAAIGAVP